MPKRIADPAKIPGATFYRLKPVDNDDTPAADRFIARDAREIFIGEITEDAARLYLYGRDEEGEPPSYAEFLRRFEGFSAKPNRRYGYVLIVQRTTAPQCWYAVAFGGGRYFLKEELIDVEAHRDVARRETIPRQPGKTARLKQIRTKLPGTSTVTTEKRTTKPGSLSDLDIDIYTDVIDEVFGEPYDKAKFGSGLSGGQGLTLRKGMTLADISTQAALFETSFIEAAAEQDAVVVGMRTVKSQEIIDRLDARLLEMLRDVNNQNIAFALPYFVSSDAAPLLHISKLGRSGVFPDDIALSQYRSVLIDTGKMQSVDLDYLKTASVSIGDDRSPSFSLYRCLPATVDLDGTTYVHDERAWYSVPTNVREEINTQIDRIEQWEGILPSSPHARITEERYNLDRNGGDILNLDRKTQEPFPEETRVEMCDLLTLADDRLTFIHVKRDFSSSTLSHLFNQGRVSALMLQEAEPRERFLARIEEVAGARRGRQPSWKRRLRRILGSGSFVASNIRVVYAILGDWSGASPSARLPFFSKVMLLRAARELRGREFDVRICRLQMPGHT